MINSIPMIEGDVALALVDVSMLGPSLVGADVVEHDVCWRNESFGSLVAVVACHEKGFPRFVLSKAVTLCLYSTMLALLR